ncbi:hypothetical protein G6011_06459 [Alternaria panax]|uniref:Uncharacterized protein n=1 Tax=Alternaria panax TaxID=48097 RepID=A0AAD4FH89_9PLEO|nr:hypothetical protein G6011_06459 [Alternaria panax]
MKPLAFFCMLPGVLSLNLTAVPTRCTKEGVYCLDSLGTNSDVFKILTSSLVTPKPMPTGHTQSITTSDTILPSPPVFTRVPSTVGNPLTSRTSTNQLPARQTQSSFHVLIFSEANIRGKGTSFDADRCILNSEMPWPIRSLVVERDFECMFWDRDDCSESASPRRKEESASDRKIIGEVKFGFGIRSLRCRAVMG